jgi:hypothetical protein
MKTQAGPPNGPRHKGRRTNPVHQPNGGLTIEEDTRLADRQSPACPPPGPGLIAQITNPLSRRTRKSRRMVPSGHSGGRECTRVPLRKPGFVALASMRRARRRQAAETLALIRAGLREQLLFCPGGRSRSDELFLDLFVDRFTSGTRSLSYLLISPVG